jgi:hypothetical protein
MSGVFLFLFLFQTSELEKLTRAIDASGRVWTIAADPSERVQPQERVAPGPPPLLAFRHMQGQQSHRFSSLDLVVDDAGH